MILFKILYRELSSTKPNLDGLIRVTQLHKAWIVIILTVVVLGGCSPWDGKLEPGIYENKWEYLGQDAVGYMSVYYEGDEMRMRPMLGFKVMSEIVNMGGEKYIRIKGRSKFSVTDGLGGDFRNFHKINPKKDGWVDVIKRVNFRAESNTHCQVMEVLDIGERLDVIKHEGRWYFVMRSDQRVGWVHESLVSKI